MIQGHEVRGMSAPRSRARYCAGMFGAGLLVALFPGAATAASWCVNPAVSTCKATIGAAITAAGPNDVINVAPGTYKESVVIGKSLVLSGSDSAKTIIDATGLSTGI